MENEITLDVVEPTAPATEPNFGPLDVIGTLFNAPEAEGEAPTALPGYHVNSPWPIAAFADKQVTPTTPRRVFAGGTTLFYSFTDEAEFLALLDGADLSQPVVVPVPEAVTRFQARAALAQAGLLDSVNAMMDQPDTPVIVKLAWADALEFRRHSPTVLALADALGLNASQLDALFIAAAQIEA